MLLEITKEDLEEGDPRNCRNCALAKALKRKYPDTFIYVNRLFAFIGAHDRVRLTKEAIQFTKEFDDPITRRALKPTTLEIGEKELDEPNH